MRNNREINGWIMVIILLLLCIFGILFLSSCSKDAGSPCECEVAIRRDFKDAETSKLLRSESDRPFISNDCSLESTDRFVLVDVALIEEESIVVQFWRQVTCD